MKVSLLHEHIMQKNNVSEERPFGADFLVFKIGGKIFAILAVEASPLRLNLKCEPDQALFLRDVYPAVKPGYHMNKRHWNTVILDESLSDDVIFEMIDESYNLVVKKLPRLIRKEIEM